MLPRSVAILHHQGWSASRQAAYLLSYVAAGWARRGVEVHHVRGTRKLVPADVAILHVDLSRVPAEYARFATRYPLALNTGVLDIRKRTVSNLVLADPAAYPGPVIVKTDLNAGGGPERWLRRQAESRWVGAGRRSIARLLRLLPDRFRRPSIQDASSYRIYPSGAQVPPRLWRDPRLVVERFLPERRGPWYCHRRYYFLGRAEVNQVWLTNRAVIVNDEGDLVEEAPVPPALRDLRCRLGIDYGKIDYVLGPEGEVIVFDVNKTPYGFCRNPDDLPWRAALCRELEGGIEGWAPPDPPPTVAVSRDDGPAIRALGARDTPAPSC